MSQENPQPKYFSRSEFVAALEQNIEQLQRVLLRVKQESIETWPESSILEDLQQTTAQINETLVTTPVVSPSQEQAVGGMDEVLPSFSSLESWWDRVLAQVRSLLPESWREKVSDWLLTGVVTGTVVVLLLALVSILPANPSPSVDDISTPPEEIVAANPPELTAPELPQPVALAPLPEPTLTPEQNLLVSLQEALRDLVRQYPDDMIQGIQADFAASRLIVTLGQGWYGLSPNRQDNLANYIWQRSQRLDFKDMEIFNSDKNLIARNPVVGDKVIILERSNPNS